MPNAHTTVVVGGDGGIGAAYVTAALAEPTALYLTSRRPVSGLPQNTPKVSWLQLDFEEQNSIEHFVEELAAKTDRIDTLLIASGVLHQSKILPEKNLSMLSSTTMQRLFCVNAAGPLTLLSKLERLLKKSTQPKVVFLSAQVGSIEDNHLGGWYSYRMSKAALNMGIKTAAIETSRWRNPATIVAVHPGTTHTPLSKPFVTRRKAPVQSAALAGKRLHGLIENLRPDQTGSFQTLTGAILPW